MFSMYIEFLLTSHSSSFLLCFCPFFKDGGGVHSVSLQTYDEAKIEIFLNNLQQQNTKAALAFTSVQLK